MIHKLAALFVATLIAVTSVPTFAYAQNVSSTTNTTTTETNTTLPLEPTQLPTDELVGDENITTGPIEPQVCPPLCGNETTEPPVLGNENVTTPSNATIVLGLLDDAQIKIDEARDLIRGLQAQIEAGKEQPAANDTEEIIQDANDSAEEIIDIIEDEVTNDTEVVDDVGNTTEDVIDTIEDSIEGNDNATSENIENVTDEVIEIIDNSTEEIDNSTTEAALDNAMIRLLSNLVGAQDYNEGLGQEQRDELKANLQDAIAELASDAADALR